jgi:hypothetical protein
MRPDGATGYNERLDAQAKARRALATVRWRRAVRWPRLRTTASHSRATAPMRRSEETSASRRALVLPQYSSTRHAVPN